MRATQTLSRERSDGMATRVAKAKRQLAAGAASAGFSAFGAAALAPPSAAGAASAAFAASSSLALRSLRGTAFSGLLRFGRFMMPAASRKRMTRSDRSEEH